MTRRFPFVVNLFLSFGLAVLGAGLTTAGEPETRRMAPNPEYEASGAWKFWFGKGYRDL